MRRTGLGVALVLGLAGAAWAGAGEADKLDVHVEFLAPAGFTTTDPTGIHYHFYGMVFSEPKIYPTWTFGRDYPLYFMGDTMRFRVHLTNIAPRGQKSFKVRVAAHSHVMETSGFAGRLLAAPGEWVIESLAPGERKTVEGEVYIPLDPTLPSGLDVTKVRVFHLNSGREGAALIKEETAVWCPPRK